MRQDKLNVGSVTITKINYITYSPLPTKYISFKLFNIQVGELKI